MPRSAELRAATAPADADGFLEQAAGLHAQELDPDTADDRLTVSTIHRAKGTEATLVVLLGCEEQLLPSCRSSRGVWGVSRVPACCMESCVRATRGCGGASRARG
ncbi:MAG: 3'-5' exonuclease [Solirubrobacteraceae bacterium]